MSIATIEAFAKIYWSHPFFSKIDDPWLRLRLLPSAYLSHKTNGKADVKERIIRRSGLEKGMRKSIVGLNDTGYDCYYFANAVDLGVTSWAKDENITQQLWFWHDFDFKLPLPILEIYDEFGFPPACVVQTSKRRSVEGDERRYQTLLGIDVEDGNDVAKCVEVLQKYIWAFGADPSTKNPSRILRLPGLLNWKHKKPTCGDPILAELVTGSDRAGETWALSEIEEYVDKFEKTELSKEMRRLALGVSHAQVEKKKRAGEKRLRQIHESDDILERWANAHGSWQDAMTAAEKGEWSAPAGGRHNALCSWGGQMAREGVLKKDIIRNMRFLADKGCEGGYSEKRDLELLIRDAVRFSDDAEKEVESALFDSEGDDENANENDREENGKHDDLGDKSDEFINRINNRSGADSSGTWRPTVFCSAKDNISEVSDREEAIHERGEAEGDRTRTGEVDQRGRGDTGEIGQGGEEGDRGAADPVAGIDDGGLADRGSNGSSGDNGDGANNGEIGAHGDGGEGELGSSDLAVTGGDGREETSSRDREDKADNRGESTGDASASTAETERGRGPLGEVGQEALGGSGGSGNGNDTPPVPPGGTGGSGGGEKKAEKADSFEDENDSYVSLAKDFSRRLPHESADDYLNFLALCAIKAAFVKNKQGGSHEPLAAILFKRLVVLGTVRRRALVLPRWFKRVDGRVTLAPTVLDRDQATAFVREYVCALSAELHRAKKKLADLDRIKDQGSKFVIGFAAQGAVLTGVVQAVLGKVALHIQEMKQPGNIIVFQNGVFVVAGQLVWHGKRYEAGSFAPDEEGKWFRQARWLYPNPMAGYFIYRVNGIPGKCDAPAYEEMPRMMKYLNDTFPGDDNQGTREALMPRIIGYSMLRGNPFQRFFAFIGAAGAGKGVFCELMENLAGPWNATRVSYKSLQEPWGFGPFEEKTLVIAEEAESADKATHEDVTSAIKNYTGAERFSLRKMREDERTVETTAKIAITANKEFTVNDASGALQRRLICLWFGSVRAEGMQIDALGRRIAEEEGDRVSTWAAVELSRAWPEGGKLFSEESVKSRGGAAALIEGKREIESMISPIMPFLRDFVVRRPGEKVAAGVIEKVIRILLEHDRIGKFSGRVPVNVKDVMQQLGYSRQRAVAGMYYVGCGLNRHALLTFSGLEINQIALAFGGEPESIRNELRESLGIDCEAISEAMVSKETDSWNL